MEPVVSDQCGKPLRVPPLRHDPVAVAPADELHGQIQICFRFPQINRFSCREVKNRGFQRGKTARITDQRGGIVLHQPRNRFPENQTSVFDTRVFLFQFQDRIQRQSVHFPAVTVKLFFPTAHGKTAELRQSGLCQEHPRMLRPDPRFQLSEFRFRARSRHTGGEQKNQTQPFHNAVPLVASNPAPSALTVRPVSVPVLLKIFIDGSAGWASKELTAVPVT